MNIYVAVTDYDWFQLLASKAIVDEVNFWRPSSGNAFKVLTPGEILLFKLHAPQNYIAGGGFFARFVVLPVSLAWDAFAHNNGARSIDELRTRITKYRRSVVDRFDDPKIGCILLEEPFFLREQDWIPCPPDFHPSTQQGKTFSTDSVAGQQLWHVVSERLERIAATAIDPGPATFAATESARYGRPTIVFPRLGQGSFRILVTDAYGQRCSMTNERTLPVLEAAHIRPYADGGKHELSNGLLLRSDLHTLFDKGYLTVDPSDHRIVVSSRIREEFENGRDYYQLHGRQIRLPLDPVAMPSRASLEYHSQVRFR